MVSVVRILELAIVERLTLDIIYLGGSSPGAVRTIYPIDIKNDLLFARDYASNQIKNFKISKIQSPLENKNAELYDPKSPLEFTGLSQVLKALQPLIADPSLIVYDDDKLLILDRFKNGRIKDSPVASISFEPYIFDTFEYSLDDNEIVEQKRKSVNPWRVYNKSAHYRSNFKNFNKAANKFLLLLQT